MDTERCTVIISILPSSGCFLAAKILATWAIRLCRLPPRGESLLLESQGVGGMPRRPVPSMSDPRAARLDKVGQVPHNVIANCGDV